MRFPLNDELVDDFDEIIDEREPWRTLGMYAMAGFMDTVDGRRKRILTRKFNGAGGIAAPLVDRQGSDEYG